LADDKLKLYRSEDLQTFQGQARVSPPTSTNWYISTSGSSIFPLKKNQNQEAEIFNLSFEKNQNQEADCTATFAQPSKKHMY